MITASVRSPRTNETTAVTSSSTSSALRSWRPRTPQGAGVVRADRVRAVLRPAPRRLGGGQPAGALPSRSSTAVASRAAASATSIPASAEFAAGTAATGATRCSARALLPTTAACWSPGPAAHRRRPGAGRKPETPGLGPDDVANEARHEIGHGAVDGHRDPGAEHDAVVCGHHADRPEGVDTVRILSGMAGPLSFATCSAPPWCVPRRPSGRADRHDDPREPNGPPPSPSSTTAWSTTCGRDGPSVRTPRPCGVPGRGRRPGRSAGRPTMRSCTGVVQDLEDTEEP